jgi:thiol-disulfide isomerase/thioredoxin
MNSPQKLKVFSAADELEPGRNEINKPFVDFQFCSRLNLSKIPAILACVVFLCAGVLNAQTKKVASKTPAPKNQTVANLLKVTQVDAEALKNLLKPNGKPLLVNFWATWCDPCREEFPDLVKIGADYKDKIDLITVSLDELSEINGDVPKFLAQMKSDAPAYLLKTPDEGAAIAVVSKNWQGGLPFTILYNAGGETVYIKQGKFKTEFLRAEIEKIISKTPKPESEIIKPENK